MPAIREEIYSIHPTPEINNILLGKTNWSTDLTHTIFSKIFKSTSETSTPLSANVENLDSVAFSNLIDYLNAYIRTKGKLEGSDLKNLLCLFHKGIVKFSRRTQFDESAFKDIVSLTNLFSGISTRHFQTEVHDQTMMLLQLGDLLGKLIAKIGSDSKDTTQDFLAPYLNAARSLVDNPTILTHGHSEITRSVVKLGEDCLSVEKCNHISRLSQIFSVLGTMTAKLQGKFYVTKTIQEKALALMEKATKQLTLNERKELAFEYVRHAEAGQSLDYIYYKCAQLFALPDCHFLPEPTSTSSTSSFSTNSTLSTPSETTTSLASNPTESTTLDNDPTSALPVNESNLSKKLAGGAIVGFGMGVKDELLAVLRDTCINAAIAKKYSPLAINSIKSTFWLINTFSTTALPLLYSYIYNIMLADEEKYPLTTSQLIISTSICFSLEALSTATYLLPKNSTFKNILSYIKFLLVLSFMFATSDSIGENAVVFATGATAGAAGKFATKRLIKFFNASKKNTSKNTFEMLENGEHESLTSSDSDSGINSNSTQSSNASLPNPANICYFIKLNKFEPIKNELNAIVTCLKSISLIFENYNHATQLAKNESPESGSTFYFEQTIKANNFKLALINESITEITLYQSLLNDEKHHNACLTFGSPEELLKDPSVKGLHALLKGIQQSLNTLNANLLKIKGADGNTFRPELQTHLTSAEQYIHAIVGFIKIVFDTYDSKAQGVAAKNSTVINANVTFRDPRRNTIGDASFSGTSTSSSDEAVSLITAAFKI